MLYSVTAPPAAPCPELSMLLFQNLYSLCNKLEDAKADKEFVHHEVDVVGVR